MIRKEGYYWVKYKWGINEPEWMIAKWCKSIYGGSELWWNMPGFSAKDVDFEEIDERMIVRQPVLPNLGDHVRDCYLHGAGTNEDINCKGVVVDVSNIVIVKNLSNGNIITIDIDNIWPGDFV